MTHSETIFKSAEQCLVGGVNSPVRSFRAVGGTPPIIKRASGAYLEDVDDNRYIDYVGSWGPAILGHAHPDVVKAVCETAQNGLSFGATCEAEVTLALQVKELVPSIDLVRFVNSGTEATLSAIRVARGFTGRNKIIKFNGCYHGHGDSFLVKAGSGAMTLGEPDSAGVPRAVAKDTLIAEYNDLISVDRLLHAEAADIAAIIVEPVAGNMGCIPPHPHFLQGLRDRATQAGIVLIFDEVMTGFRVALGGAQARFGITPDMTCLGKIIGGGMPVAAYGGRKEIMHCVAPTGPVYQAGTLSGNPLGMAAGIATLARLSPASYETLEALGARLEAGVMAACKQKGIPASFSRVGSMWTLFFSETPPQTAHDVEKTDSARFKRLFHHALQNGVYLAPSAYESCFISLAHTTEDIDRTIAVISEGL